MHHIAIIGGYIALAIASVIWIYLVIVTIKFVTGPPPIDDYTPEFPFPGPIIQPKAQRERFADEDCRTDYDVLMEASRRTQDALTRARMKKANLN